MGGASINPRAGICGLGNPTSSKGLSRRARRRTSGRSADCVRPRARPLSAPVCGWSSLHSSYRTRVSVGRGSIRRRLSQVGPSARHVVRRECIVTLQLTTEYTRPPPRTSRRRDPTESAGLSQPRPARDEGIVYAPAGFRRGPERLRREGARAVLRRCAPARGLVRHAHRDRLCACDLSTPTRGAEVARSEKRGVGPHARVEKVRDLRARFPTKSAETGSAAISPRSVLRPRGSTPSSGDKTVAGCFLNVFFATHSPYHRH
jgi:hypothetical protein